MRVAVVRNQVPFVHGGAERHAARLCEALRLYGHDATEVTLPFKWYPAATLVDHVAAARHLDLSEAEGVPIDLMVGLKFPAWLARHPDVVFWIIHQHRQAYDMWEDGTSDLLDQPDGLAVKQMIEAEDRAAFARTQRPIYANSGNVAARLKRHLGIASEVLYHPPPLADALRTGGYGTRLFAPGRINPSKRVDLILRALAHAGPGVAVDIAGTPENPTHLEELKALAAGLGVADRVRWLGPVSDAELIAHYAECRGVIFTPRDEDYGYITLEAMIAGKAVVTVTDAGGPLEFVEDGRTGLVAPPDAAGLGAALERLSGDAALAERLGQAARESYLARDIRWDRVVEALTGQGARLDAPPPEREGVAQPAPPAPASAPPASVALASAIAPRAPAALPFASVSEVLEAYDLAMPMERGADGALAQDDGLVSYLQSHWSRFLNTLHHVERLAPRDILDVGAFPPLVFDAMLAASLKDIDLSAICMGPQAIRTVFPARDGRFPDLPVHIQVADVDRQPLPYPDASFDLVLAMEIIEHLALDPHFFLSQASRVLRPGGHVLLTTPNICSHRGVWKMLANEAPYSFGVFVPSDGPYGRHNREYAPRELATFGAAAGFETEFLGTADVYGTDLDPAMAEMLQARGDDLGLRGENIVYVGRKVRAPGPAPERYYHGDPVAMQAALSVDRLDDLSGLVRVRVRNLSPVMWGAAGPRATTLLAEWSNGAGEYEGRAVLPLDGPVPAGGTGALTLRLDPAGTDDPGQLRLHVNQRDVGPFTGTGRSNTVTLPCTEQAFARLVATGRGA